MWKNLTFIFLACLFTGLISAQTPGTLTVTATTSSTGGDYEPNNVVAIWVENSTGGFVKTLLAYANNRRTHLNTWEASTTTAGTAFNIIDAVSGVTQTSHGTRTAQWNGTDYNGTLVADGNYNLRMELTDKNATGNTASFTFAKGPTAVNLTPANVPSFSSISLNWVPMSTAVDPDLTESNTFVVYPNPGTGQFTVLGDDIIGLEVKDLTGKTVGTSTTPVIDLTGLSDGVYLMSIKTGSETVIRKIVKE
jgi:hypothetical protein